MEKFKRFKAQKTSEKIFTVLLTILLFAFLGLVFYVNLSCNPEFYNGDIYADIQYAKEAWKAKSLFPSNWVFGNQTYVVATPVLAALIYGIIGNAITAMAVASCIMSVLIVLTYDWMMKPIFSYNERTAGFLAMVGILFAEGNVATATRGAQVFFTMASYYSCYLITAFLVFGCYIRLKSGKRNKRILLLCVIACLLSFATGMQSLRQTAVMTLPLVAYEFLNIFVSSIKRKKLSISINAGFSAAIFVSNIAGVIFMKTIDINQETIYTGSSQSLGLISLKEVAGKLYQIFSEPDLNILWIEKAGVLINSVFSCFVFAIILAGIIIDIIALKKNKLNVSVNFLLTLGCITILIIESFTNMEPRDIYLFMIFPLVAVSVAQILKALKAANKLKILRAFAMSALCVCFLGSLVYQSVIRFGEINSGKSTQSISYEISEYMQENRLDTLYAQWGWAIYYGGTGGEGVAVASNDKIALVFLKEITEENGFSFQKYICVKEEYINTNNDKIAYLFESTLMDFVTDYCNKNNVQIEVLGRWDNSVLCKLSENICVAVEQNVD